MTKEDKYANKIQNNEPNPKICMRIKKYDAKEKRMRDRTKKIQQGV